MSNWSNKTHADLERYEKMLSESDIPLTYDVPTLFKLIRGWQEAALHEAASVMPIETLHGSDDSSVWLREYADNWGTSATTTHDPATTTDADSTSARTTRSGPSYSPTDNIHYWDFPIN